MKKARQDAMANVEFQSAMKRKLNEVHAKAKASVMQVQSDHDNDAIIALYIKKYRKKDNSYENGYQEPTPPGKDGHTTLKFPTPVDAASFFMEAAHDHTSFIVIDAKTKMVTAYSNGDGVLRRADGTEYKAGDPMVPSTTPLDQLKMLEPAPRPAPPV